MKLKRLTIDNIASIEHAVIDFDAAPLADEHLFLITGETGSGKSTIIDCLCLALYGNTPRLNGVKKAEYESIGSQEIIKTSDAKQLLRRGAVTGDVTLTFDNNDGVPYIATWHIQRKHKKADNKIMSPERKLMTEDGVTPPVFLRNKTDIDAHVIELTGLDMNEFFRTVVLAQGKFAEFLNSDENEKAALLEKMTGTEVYAQVGTKIYEVCRDKENKRNLLLDAVKNIVLLSDEEKAAIGDQVNELLKQQGLAAQQRDQAKKMTDWLDEKAQNEKKLFDKQQELTQQQELSQRPEYLERQQLVIDWEDTIEPRRESRDLLQATKQITELQALKPAMQEEYDDLCAALRATIDNTRRMREQCDEIGDYLKQEEPNRGMYEAITTIKSLMKQRKQEQSNIEAFTLTLKQEQDNLPKVKEQVNDTEKAMEQKDEKVKQLQARYDDIKVDNVTTKKDALTKAQLALTLLKTKHDTVDQAQTAIDKLKTELAEEQNALDKENASIETKRALKVQANDALEREKDWNALIEQAHKSLHQGEKCPVCGNVIIELQPPKGINVLDELRKRLQLATDDVERAEAAIVGSGKAVKRITQQISEAQKTLADRMADRDQQWQQTQSLLTSCGQQVREMADKAHCDSLIQAIGTEVEALNAVLQQAATLNNSITTERNTLSRLTEAHNKAVIQHNKAIDSIKHQGQVIADSKSRLEQRTRELDGLFTMSDWQELAASRSDFIEQLEQKATYYQRQTDAARQLEHAIGVAQALIPAMQENKGNIVGLTDNGRSCSQVPDKLDELWRQFENKNIGWNNQLTNEKKNAERARQAIDTYLNDHPDMSMERLALIDKHSQGEIADIKRTHKTFEQQLAHTKGEIASLNEQRGNILAKKPDCEEQDREKLTEIFSTNQERYEQLNDLIAEHKARLKADQDNVNTVGEKKKALDEAEAVYRQWAEFSSRLGSADGKTFRKIAQSYILGELLASANGYLRQFNGRYELEANPGTLVILVRDLMQGDLTSVNTLSGGESFMVSLALALALSSTTGKMFSVDTLFIDEGFGSLSENYLDNVMETLNRLYDMGGRRVGIISHVELLKERVTTQIQVTRDPRNNTASNIMVCG